MPINDPDGSRVLDAIAALRQARMRFHEAPLGSPAAEEAATEIEWRIADVQRAVRVLDRTAAAGAETIQTLPAAPDIRRIRTH